MKTLKLLGNFFFFTLFTFIFFLHLSVNSNEPVDIWELKDQQKNEDKIIEDNNSINTDSMDNNSNYEESSIVILEENSDKINNVELVGLYDPEENNLDIDMWFYSDGDQVKAILKKINTIKLSNDSKLILKIALLTNSYPPTNKIKPDEFNKLKVYFLEKNNDLNLIKEFIIKNQDLSINKIIIKKYINNYLINGDLDTSCSLFDEIDTLNFDDYLDKFKIYCLIKNNKKDEAQLLFDLKKEQNFKDNFFENKFYNLMGYNDDNLEKISEASVLDFHLSQVTNQQFNYSPVENTPSFIWKYLSSYNLLEGINTVDLEDNEKIKNIEKATHEKNYDESELLNLYKRYDFTLEQLLSVNEIYKILPNHKARAILYQRLLLTYDVKEKLSLAKKIKNLMIEDEIENAFNKELSNILLEIDLKKVPTEFSTFYKNNIEKKENKDLKTKFNNKIIHQSKLLNYFFEKYDIEKINKETNDMLKKVKSNKKYIFSNKDKILIDSLEYDGVKIKKQYKNLYEKNPNIPTDLQVLINNNDLGMLLLRLVEIIGEDNIEDLGTETLYFITTVLNEVNLDQIRNKIIVKTLPQKI